MLAFLVCACVQVVNGCSLAEAAEKVIVGVRFPLLSTDMLTRVDDENKVKQFIPVSQWTGLSVVH